MSKSIISQALNNKVIFNMLGFASTIDHFKECYEMIYIENEKDRKKVIEDIRQIIEYMDDCYSLENLKEFDEWLKNVSCSSSSDEEDKEEEEDYFKKYCKYREEECMEIDWDAYENAFEVWEDKSAYDFSHIVEIKKNINYRIHLSSWCFLDIKFSENGKLSFNQVNRCKYIKPINKPLYILKKNDGCLFYIDEEEYDNIEEIEKSLDKYDAKLYKLDFDNIKLFVE